MCAKQAGLEHRLVNGVPAAELCTANGRATELSGYKTGNLLTGEL